MNTRHTAAALWCAVALATPLAATATTVTVKVSLDVADIVLGAARFTGGVQGTPPFSSPFSVTLAAGDTFDFTIDFVGNETLTLYKPSLIWAFSYADSASDVVGTGSLSLLGTTGAALYTSNVKTDTEGSLHFGQQFSASDFTGLPNSVTFGGLRYVGTLDQYLEPGVTSRTYDTPALYFTAVPTPSAWVAMVLGLGTLLAVGRRGFAGA